MAMSARERKQKQLEREQEQLKQLDDSTYPFLQVPFFEWVQEDPNWSSVTLELELAGIQPPSFEDDGGPEVYASEDALPPDSDPAKTFPGAKGSIGRAEEMVDRFLTAAIEMAGMINRYKRYQLEQKRNELESSDLSDPETRKNAFETIGKITKIEEELGKNIRRTLPQWKVKGI